MKLKGLLTSTLTASLLFVLTACGDENIDPVTNTDDNGTTEGRVDPDGEPAIDYVMDYQKGELYLALYDRRGDLIVVHAGRPGAPDLDLDEPRNPLGWELHHFSCMASEGTTCLLDPAEMLELVRAQFVPNQPEEQALRSLQETLEERARIKRPDLSRPL